MKSQKQPNPSTSTARSIDMNSQDSSNENRHCNRIKVTVGKKWEIEVSSKSNYVIPLIWLSTLSIVSFIVLYMFGNV